MDHMETKNTCCFCDKPYYRVEALSGTAPLPLHVMPYYEMDKHFPKAPYRLWPCCEHGAHTKCLTAAGALAKITGPCFVCEATSPPAVKRQNPVVTACKIPLLPLAKRMKVTEAEKNKNANDGDQNPPMAMPVPLPPKTMPVPLAPWRKGRRK